jgi:hypothetical protein
MSKFLVKQSFRITDETFAAYAAHVETARAATPQGEMKPPLEPRVGLTNGAIYIAGDTIEVTPLEAAALAVIAPPGALEAVT